MRYINDMKLGVKTLIPLSCMAVLFLGATAFGAMQLIDLERRSNHIIEHIQPALSLSERADSSIQRAGYNAYRVLSYQTGTKAMDDAIARYKLTSGSAEQFLDEAAVLYPERAEDFIGFKSRLQVIKSRLDAQEAIAETTNGFILGSRNDAADMDKSAAVVRELVDIDSEIDALGADLAAFVGEVQAENAQAAKALQAASSRAVWMMIVIGLAAIVCGSGCRSG